MRLHLPKGLLAALLAACFVSTVPLAEAHQTISSDKTENVILTNGDRLLFDGTGSTAATITYTGNITSNGTDHWCGPGNAAGTGADNNKASYYVKLTGAISGSALLKFNDYATTSGQNVVWELSGSDTYTDAETGDVSKFSGGFLLDHGGGTKSYAQLTLSGTFSNSNVVDLSKDMTILHIAHDVELGGLKGTPSGGSVTSVDGVTVTLNVVENVSYSGSIGTGRYFTTENYTAEKPGAISAAVNIIKKGTATQTLTGTLNLGSLEVSDGTLSLSGKTTLSGESSIATGATLSNTGSLVNNGNLLISGTYTGKTIVQASGTSLILKDGAVVNLDGLEQQKFCSATETGSQSYYTQYVLSTHDIGSIEDDATVQFNLSGQEVGGTFDKGAYTLSASAGTCYNIASGATVSYSSLASAETGDFINVVGTLTADAAITKSVNLAGGTLVGKGYDVTGDVSITKDSSLRLNGDMSLTGAISSVSGHTLIVSLDQGVTSGALTISGSAALNNDGEVITDAQVGKLNYGTLQIENGVTVNVSGRKGGNAQIAGAVVVKGGGTLNLTSADTLGYGGKGGGNFTDSITLEGSTTTVDGVSTSKVAILNLTATQTLTTDLILKGNTSITGLAMNSFGGSITATGTNNDIGNEVQVRSALDIVVQNAEDTLQMKTIVRNSNNSDNSFTKKGAGLLTITDNVGAADTGKDIKNVTVEAGKMEVKGAFYGNLTQQGGETVLGGRSTITTMDCTGGSVEMKGADSSITTLTGSGSLKVSGNTGVTDASGFSGSLESGAVLSISEGVKGLKSLKINTGGQVWAFTGTETNSISSIKIDEVVLAGGTAGIYVKGPSTNTTVQTDTLTVSAASTLSADLTLLDNAGLVVNVGGVTAETETAICSLNGALTLGSELSLTLSNLGKFKAGDSIKLFSDVTSVTYTIPTTGGETEIAALSEDVGTTGTLDAMGVDASQIFGNLTAGDFKLTYSGVDNGGIVALVAQRDVPEPTTATLSLLALMGLAARRRRKA